MMIVFLAAIYLLSIYLLLAIARRTSQVASEPSADVGQVSSVQH